MNQRIFASGVPITLALACAVVLFSCASTSQEYLSAEDCDRLESVPDSCVIDTLGILGAIFPKGYVYQGDSALSGPYSTWTPSRADIMLAEQIMRRRAKTQYRCIDEDYTRFYRQYAGRGQYNNCVLIHGIRMSKQITICGKKSFWINIYQTGCSIFDAFVDIRLGTCDVVFQGEK